MRPVEERQTQERGLIQRRRRNFIVVLVAVIKRVLSIALHLFRITVKEDYFVLIIVDFMKIILVLDQN